MRILHVITCSELGGAQVIVANLSNELCKSHEVIVAVGEGDGKMFNLLDKAIVREKIPNLVRRLSAYDDLKAYFQLKRLYRKYRPDIIHLHSSKAGVLGRLAFPKDKTVYTVHGFDSVRIRYRKLLPIEKMLQKRCSAIVGVSLYDKQNLISEGISHNVSYVYNGIPPVVRTQDNPFLQLGSGRQVVLCIARLHPPKNHNLFLRIASKLPQYEFVWIGNVDAPDFDFPANVHFFGNIENAAAYVGHASLFLLPSNYEGLPVSILEALASGIPVVASRVGGIPELLNGTNGFATDNDADMMTLKINEILSDSPEQRLTRSENAVAVYSNSFTLEKMTAGYLAIYGEIYSDKK